MNNRDNEKHEEENTHITHAHTFLFVRQCVRVCDGDTDQLLNKFILCGCRLQTVTCIILSFCLICLWILHHAQFVKCSLWRIFSIRSDNGTTTRTARCGLDLDFSFYVSSWQIIIVCEPPSSWESLPTQHCLLRLWMNEGEKKITIIMEFVMFWNIAKRINAE